MANAVVFDDSITSSAETDGVVVFDLSRREILHKDIVSKAIEKITSDSFYTSVRPAICGILVPFR
jgi:hypothetical protein